MANATIIVEGRLPRDVEVRTTQSGKRVANVSLPVQASRKNEAGQWENTSATAWYQLTLWDEDTALVADWRKGDTVVLTGMPVPAEYQNDSADVNLDLKWGTAAMKRRESAENGRSGGQAQRRAQAPQGGAQGGWDVAPIGQGNQPADWGTPF